MAVIGMMILPMPAWGLDVGLAASFSLAILIFTVTLFIQQPLDFSSFPTVLLASLMLRLSLNVSSTKLIIGEGHTGTDAAGEVIEGFAMFALNQGEVCTCPSRALVQENIADAFLERAVARVKNIKQGNPLQMETMIGGQASTEQMEKITGYLKLGREEGASVLTGGDKAALGEGLNDGYYVQPTVFRGDNSMRIFQEEIFGPVLSVTTFKDEAEAIAIANDTTYGLGAGVWTRNGNSAFRVGRAIEAGRVWTNCYHHYPAHAAFGGYKKSGIGRENHKMMLDHYRNTKNLLVSYDENPMGFF